jgi:hypothetical protein
MRCRPIYFRIAIARRITLGPDMISFYLKDDRKRRNGGTAPG